MKTKAKGEYGYRNSHIKMQAIKVVCCVVFIFAQLIARNFTDNQAAKNILTVMAILSVLPMANIASPFLVSLRYRTSGHDFYEKVSANTQGPILYDLILTSPEQVIPADAVMVHPVGVFVYCSNPKLDAKKAETYLNTTFKSRKLDPNVKFFLSEDKFLKRLKSLKPASEYEDDGSMEYAVSLLKSLSM